MKERPIIFNGEMVRAILEGRKIQTRRVVLMRHLYLRIWAQATHWEMEEWNKSPLNELPVGVDYLECCPYGEPGDRLWVRETWQLAGALFYRADGDPDRETLELYPNWKWRPSIFMPRCASRITLEIVSVQVERVQDISPDEAIAEGVVWYPGKPWYAGTAKGWDEAHTSTLLT
jgi:hypothetical protein